MHSEMHFGRSPLMISQPNHPIVAAQPLRFLLECPSETAELLGNSSVNLECTEGQSLFTQSDLCKGLFLLVSGQFVRRVERLGTRLMLAPGGPGELVELAAALGDKCHTYTLVAKSTGTVLFWPIEALEQAFGQYPSLRMRLLEELAREVSRAYSAVWLLRMGKVRRARAS